MSKSVPVLLRLARKTPLVYRLYLSKVPLAIIIRLAPDWHSLPCASQPHVNNKNLAWQEKHTIGVCNSGWFDQSKPMKYFTEVILHLGDMAADEYTWDELVAVVAHEAAHAADAVLDFARAGKFFVRPTEARQREFKAIYVEMHVRLFAMWSKARFRCTPGGVFCRGIPKLTEYFREGK